MYYLKDYTQVGTMNKLDVLDDNHFIFGAIFMIANKLDTHLDRELNPFGLTAKQWFLTIVIDMLFDESPTIKQVARAMGSSHQNVKQVALKLEQKGLLTMEKDIKDGRATRLKFTEESQPFWGQTQQKGHHFMEAVFKSIDKEGLAATRNTLKKIWENIIELEIN